MKTVVPMDLLKEEGLTNVFISSLIAILTPGKP